MVVAESAEHSGQAPHLFFHLHFTVHGVSDDPHQDLHTAPAIVVNVVATVGTVVATVGMGALVVTEAVTLFVGGTGASVSGAGSVVTATMVLFLGNDGLAVSGTAVVKHEWQPAHKFFHLHLVAHDDCLSVLHQRLHTPPELVAKRKIAIHCRLVTATK